ncbi:MAG: TVP38/TMEM64 family protein [Deltaproteobacteria bacterium]|nr:TVP38/TMEM64 family protein [Deltaproteobacteria bacterium]
MVALFFILGLHRHLSLAELKEQREVLRAWYQDHAFVLIAAFVLVYILQSALSLPGAGMLSLAAGAIFGTIAGAAIVNLGATLGATAALIFTRYLFRDAIERKLGEKAKRLSAGFARDGLNYLLFLRLVPLFPFWLINLTAGLTHLRVRTFIIGTAVGIIPGTFVFCYAGSRLVRLEKLSDVSSPGMLLAFGLLGLLALVPVIYRRLRKPAEAA